ncbi:33118_t:CDS:2, partial [Gigaspora margarita]
MSTLKEIFHTNTTLKQFYYSKEKTDDDRRRELVLMNRLKRLEQNHGSSDSVYYSWRLNFFSKLSEYEATSQFNHKKCNVWENIHSKSDVDLA